MPNAISLPNENKSILFLIENEKARGKPSPCSFLHCISYSFHFYASHVIFVVTWNIACPLGSCPIDFRPINATYGVWCLTTGNPCPSGFEGTSTLFPLYNPPEYQYEEVVGAVAQVLLPMTLTYLPILTVSTLFT